MKFSKAQLIGIFTVIVIVSIYAVITFLKDENIFNGRSSYYAIYEDVDGLTNSSPVYMKGLKVGSIWDIKYDNGRGVFIVMMKIKSAFAIPSDSKAVIAGSGLLGGKQINLLIGESTQILSPKDTICGAVERDPLASIMNKAEPVAGKMDTLITNLNAIAVKMNDMLDESTRRDIKEAVASLNSSMKSIKSIAARLHNSAPEMEEIIHNVKILSENLNTGSIELNNTLKNTSEITKGLSEADLKGTIEELKGLLVKLQNPEGSVGKLMATDTLHNSINSMVNNLNNLIKKIEQNPKKYIRISVF